VLEVLGTEEVRKIIDKYGRPGSTAYLIHEEATVGNVKESS
jgi:hypothetical protein